LDYSFSLYHFHLFFLFHYPYPLLAKTHFWTHKSSNKTQIKLWSLFQIHKIHISFTIFVINPFVPIDLLKGFTFATLVWLQGVSGDFVVVPVTVRWGRGFSSTWVKVLLTSIYEFPNLLFMPNKPIEIYEPMLFKTL
jgi:hypothetical protein